MQLTVQGTKPKKLTVNGAAVKRVTAQGVLVWQSETLLFNGTPDCA